MTSEAQPANQHHPVGPITVMISAPDDCNDLIQTVSGFYESGAAHILKPCKFAVHDRRDKQDKCHVCHVSERDRREHARMSHFPRARLSRYASLAMAPGAHGSPAR
jgi:hypothetical protein